MQDNQTRLRGSDEQQLANQEQASGESSQQETSLSRCHGDNVYNQSSCCFVKITFRILRVYN
jgi:hypothetical protein